MMVHPRLARLLSGRDEMSRLEKDQTLEQVLRETGRSPLLRARRAWLVAAISAAAGVLVAPSVWHRLAPGEFQARGAAPAATPTMTLRCLDGPLGGRHACRPGGRLAFEVVPAGSARYFAAYAQRPDGAVIWYYPSKDARSLDLAEGAAHGLLGRAIVLGAEHVSGKYKVAGVFTTRAMTRGELKAELTRRAGQPRETVVVERELDIP
jgi:hypothetical protein